jgi:HEAT repeat protein
MHGVLSEQDACIASEVAALDDRDRDQRAISMLAGLGAFSIPALVRALEDDDARVRGNAATALGRIGKAADSEIARSGLGPPLKTAVAGLAAALKDDVPTVRQEAAAALAGIGTHAKDALPALERAKQDSDALVREWANVAIRNSQNVKQR